MSELLVRYRVDPVYLVGANLGIDPEPSARRFAEALRAGLEEELPGARIDIVRGTPRGCEIEGHDPTEEATLALRVEGVARAVRACGDWIVYRG